MHCGVCFCLWHVPYNNNGSALAFPSCILIQESSRALDPSSPLWHFIDEEARAGIKLQEGQSCGVGSQQPWSQPTGMSSISILVTLLLSSHSLLLSFFSFNFYFILEYSRLTMLCQFLGYPEPLCWFINIYLFFFRFFFHLGYHRILSRVPCAIQEVLVDYLFFIYSSEYMLFPNS